MARKSFLKTLQYNIFDQMEDHGYFPCQISLREILELQDQPVSEEQAWALCFQLSTLLSDSRGEVYRPHKTLQLRGTDGVFLTNDGSVRLKMNDGRRGDYFTLETEDKIVDYIGRLIYTCLDWGLGSNVERELNESLEGLVCQMTKVTVGQNMDESFQPVRTLAEVIQICKDRLYDPDQAVYHYRKVCGTLFSETVELCRYIQNIQCARETLQKFVVEPETRLVSQMASWGYVWKNLVEELSRGVKLRPLEERLDASTPLPAGHSPCKHLQQEIQIKRLKLRKVQTNQQRMWTDPHNSLLEYVRSKPKLRPASERKLKTRPKEEASLHEMLMEEIRTVDQQKLLSSHKRRLAYKDNGSSPTTCRMSLCMDESSEDASFLINPILASEIQENDFEEDMHEKLCQKTSNRTAAEQELMFFPVLSSSPMDPHHNCAGKKRRSRSLASSLKVKPSSEKARVPLTMAEAMRLRQTETRVLRTASCDRHRNWRVCSCCSKRSIYFTWHNLCSLCNNVVCPECCIVMRVPFKWCVNLPMSFFKKIVLKEDGDQGKSQFWMERWSWDSSRIPLVLDFQVTTSCSPHSLAMRDWYSQDICTGCKGYLLNACDTVLKLCAASGPQEV